MLILYCWLFTEKSNAQLTWHISYKILLFQISDDLKMKDLSKLASKIEKNHMKRIAIEQFEIDPVDLTRIADDFRDTWEFNFEILKKWLKLSGDNNRSVSLFRKTPKTLSPKNRAFCDLLLQILFRLLGQFDKVLLRHVLKFCC